MFFTLATTYPGNILSCFTDENAESWRNVKTYLKSLKLEVMELLDILTPKIKVSGTFLQTLYAVNHVRTFLAINLIHFILKMVQTQKLDLLEHLYVLYPTKSVMYQKATILKGFQRSNPLASGNAVLLSLSNVGHKFHTSDILFVIQKASESPLENKPI